MSEKAKKWETGVKLGSIEEAQFVELGAVVISVDRASGQIVLRSEKAEKPNLRAVERE
jgi:hypothetical protein